MCISYQFLRCFVNFARLQQHACEHSTNAVENAFLAGNIEPGGSLSGLVERKNGLFEPTIALEALPKNFEG